MGTLEREGGGEKDIERNEELYCVTFKLDTGFKGPIKERERERESESENVI